MPRVSIIVPCRNELGHIAAFAASAGSQELPDGWSLEVVIADGGSDDGTRAQLTRIAAEDPRFSTVDNPDRIVSAGLNRALAASTGEVVVRMDVHTQYATNYVRECLAALAKSGADNVGGPWRAVADRAGEPMQAAVAAAFQSRWVAGGARSRRLDYDGPADTVYLGAWPRKTFARFGDFDESLVRNQDDEHNLRIVEGGGAIWQSSRIRSRYRPRARLVQVFRQYLQYGYWKAFVMRKHGKAASLRHLVPGLFVVALLVATGLALTGVGAWPLVALLGSYELAVVAMTLGVAWGKGLAGEVVVRIPAVIVAYHLAYGIGSLAGAADALLNRRGHERFTTLTR